MCDARLFQALQAVPHLVSIHDEELLNNFTTQTGIQVVADA